jgi:hypothetical protein
MARSFVLLELRRKLIDTLCRAGVPQNRPLPPSGQAGRKYGAGGWRLPNRINSAARRRSGAPGSGRALPSPGLISQVRTQASYSVFKEQSVLPPSPVGLRRAQRQEGRVSKLALRISICLTLTVLNARISWAKVQEKYRLHFHGSSRGKMISSKRSMRCVSLMTVDVWLLTKV